MFPNNKVSPLPTNNVDESYELEVNVETQNYKGIENTRTWTPHLSERIRRRTELGMLKPLKRRTKTQETCVQIKRFFREIIFKLEPWRESIKVIEGHHGNGVASYFVFLRWSVYLNFWFFLLLFSFIIIPQVAFEKKDYNIVVVGINKSYVHVNDSIRCSRLYSSMNHTSEDVGEILLDLLQGTGLVERTPLFYGYYEGKELNNKKSYILPMAYFLVCISCLIFCVIMMAKKSASNFQENVYYATPSSHYQFFSLVFLSWDYTMNDAVSAKLKLKSLKKQIISELADQQHRLKQENLTKPQYAKIIVIRIFVNIFVVICLGCCAYLIYIATQYTAMYVKLDDFDSHHESIRFIVEYTPSLTISALNAIIPIVFSLIIMVEDYLPQNKVIITLIRTILLRLASVIFLIASLYKEVTCTPKDDCNIGTARCSPIKCWETYIGQQFYKLAIMDFVIVLFLCLIIEPLFSLLSKILKLNILAPQFNVPQNVLDLVYTQSLCWLGFFFAPLLPAMILIKLFFTFYLKKLSALKWCCPFQRPYNASKSQSLFATVLMISFFFCCLPLGYIIYYVQPSRACGPFRIYNHMYDILTITVGLWPITASMIVRFMSSTAFILTVIVILILFLYHCAQRGSAQNDTIKLLRNHLKMERKEKFYYMLEASNRATATTHNRSTP